MTLFLPSSSQKAYLYSLTEAQKSIWQPNLGQVELGILRKARNTTRSVYLWDLHELANRLQGHLSGGYMIPYLGKYWHQIWLSDFEDDAGQGVYEPLETAFTVSSFNHPNALKQIYSVRSAFSPLQTITDSNGNTLSETSKGERVVYQALLCPGFPVLFGSSLPSHQHFGPLFATQVSLSASGAGTLSPVNVSFDLIGGKSVLSPRIPVAPSVAAPTPNEDGSVSYLAYRTATLEDCLMLEGVFLSVSALKSQAQFGDSILSKDPQSRVVGMELSMSQNVSFSAPVPKSPRTDDQGPRYAAISGRQVKGTITYYSRNTSVLHPTSGSITMYFGGDFLLPIPNIEWQKPQVSVKAGEGYVHTLNFLARATDYARASYAPKQVNSEFAIGAD